MPIFLLSCSVLVRLAPHLGDSTPEDGRRLKQCLYLLLLPRCGGLDSVRCSDLDCTSLSAVWQETNKNCSYFYGIHVVWSFSTVSSFAIICWNVFYVSLIIPLLLSECFQVDRKNLSQHCSTLGKYSHLYVFYCSRRIHDCHIPFLASHQS